MRGVIIEYTLSTSDFENLGGELASSASAFAAKSSHEILPGGDVSYLFSRQVVASRVTSCVASSHAQSDGAPANAAPLLVRYFCSADRIATLVVCPDYFSGTAFSEPFIVSILLFKRDAIGIESKWRSRLDIRLLVASFALHDLPYTVCHE